MGLRVVGAGIGRTGTTSLKAALERLLGGPCHHMEEVFKHPHSVPIWHAAVGGEPVDWEALLDGYVASVDWPGGAFWREQLTCWPDAVVLLSTRDDADQWYRSADRTVLEAMRRPPPPDPMIEAWHAMVVDLVASRFTDPMSDREALVAAYERHNEAVRAEAPPGQLLEWQPGDGWEPLCEALEVPVPDEPFPHANTTEQFRSMFGWD